jgi:hypothetical protein
LKLTGEHISDPISTDGGLTWYRYKSIFWEDENAAGIEQVKIPWSMQLKQN